MGSSTKIAGGLVWTTLNKLVSAGYSFITVPLLIGFYGKADYGLIGLALSLNVYMKLFDMGLSNTNLRYFSNYLAKKEVSKVKELFGTCIAFYGCVGIINALILLLLSLFIHKIFNVTPEQTVILRNLLYVIALNAMLRWYTNCFGQLVNGDEQVGYYSKIGLIGTLISIVVLVLTLTLHFPIVLYYALLVFSGFLYTTFFSVKKIREIVPDISFLPHFSKSMFIEILPYSMNIFSVYLVTWGAENLLPIFLGIRCNSSEITDFNILLTIMGFLSFISTSFNSSIFPSVSKAVAINNREAIDRVAYQGTKFLSIILCLVTFGFISISSDFMNMYLGDSFMYLVPWLDLYLLNNLGNHNAGIAAIIYSGRNIKLISRFCAFSYTFYAASFWFLIPYFGARSVAISCTAFNLIQMSFYYFYYWPKKVGVNARHIFWNDLFPFALIGLAISVGLRMISISDSHWIQFLAKGTLFVIIYYAIVVRIIKKEDKDFLYSLFLSKVHSLRNRYVM